MPSRTARRRAMALALAASLPLAATLAGGQPADAVQAPDAAVRTAADPGTGCLVPELGGLRLRVAKTELEWANCRLGAVHSRHAAAWKRGFVLEQQYAPDTVLRAGHRVGVTIGR